MSNKRKSRHAQGRRSRDVLLGLIALVLVAGAGYLVLGLNRAAAPIDPNAPDVAASLPRSDTAFNVGTRIGQAAPAFSLPDAQGNTYSFRPGDGRKYVLAFNMGFV